MKGTMMKNVSSITLASLTLLLGACGGGYSADSIADQAPQGLMEGEDWTMMSAVVTANGEDKLSVDLYPVQVEPCDGFADSDSQILFTIKREVGEFPLKFSFGDLEGSQTITFSPGPGQNVIASEGLIVVESLTDDEVTIGLVADAGESSINGRFTATICPDPFGG